MIPLTDAQRARFTRALDASHIPAHLHDGLARYFLEGILPGGFLQAVLCNDLAEAVARATPGALLALPALIEFLEWRVDAEAWGSRACVLAWTTTPDRLEIPPARAGR
jgi:hypothetical protein